MFVHYFIVMNSENTLQESICHDSGINFRLGTHSTEVDVNNLLVQIILKLLPAAGCLGFLKAFALLR